MLTYRDRSVCSCEAHGFATATIAHKHCPDVLAEGVIPGMNHRHSPSPYCACMLQFLVFGC
eukprot:1532421-Alexandrium_andersonii.AAC.1